MSNTENKIPTAEAYIKELDEKNCSWSMSEEGLSKALKEFATLHLEAQKNDILIQIYNDNGAYTAKESLDRAYNIEENVK